MKEEEGEEGKRRKRRRRGRRKRRGRKRRGSHVTRRWVYIDPFTHRHFINVYLKRGTGRGEGEGCALYYWYRFIREMLALIIKTFFK